MPQVQSHTAYDERARKRLKPRDTLVRAATVELLRRDFGRGEVETAESVLRRQYYDCAATAAYLKAASTPAMTTVATWAAELVATSVVDFMAGEMPASAFAQLAGRAMTIQLEPGVALVKVPSRASPLVLQGAWVGEGNAKPVVSTLLGAVSVAAYKLSAISTFSEEMLASTAIEQLVRQALSHDLTGLLDTALLDSTAASTGVRPAGLLNGATAVTASAATPASEAMLADLKALAAAASTGNPDARIVYVLNPQQALRLQLAAFAIPSAVVSNYMAAGSVAAVDVDALVMLVSQPQFKLSREAAIHADTVPLPLGTGTQGSGVLAVPLSSMYQTDTVALRSVLRAGWAKTRSGAAAIVTGAIW